MRFMVEVDAGRKKRMPLMARADWAVYGKASRRGAYMVVDLKSPADI
jgi:hypothetical protein